MNVLTKFLSLAVCLLFVACNGNNATAPQANNDSVTVKEAITVAYVDMDTLQAQYQYYLDCRQELETTYNGYQATIGKKAAALQNKAAEIQQKLQEGRFVSEAEFNNAQAAFAKQQADVEQLQAKYAQQFAEKELEFNKALEDSIQSFLATYNKEHKYTLILTRAVILNDNPQLDITADVVKGLNERYEKGKQK
ncbi:MAG: OmpH family outer membrane protein [Bacteroidaceae bacterium]|jgi:outer membrane protein|nr:OmpH family outer membrane protein [Bacteroidaceae bacterium]